MKPKYKDKLDKSEGESKPDYSEGNSSRSENESSEHHEVVVNKTAPENRYQKEQQINPVSTAESVEAPKTSFTKKVTDTKGSQVKQEIASKVLTEDSDYAGISGVTTTSAPSRSGLRSMSYSGDAGTILGTAANTPVVGTPSRSDGRYEKKLDAVTKKINFLASEQVLSSYDNPKPLGESGNEKQGYYGTPKNTSVRSQKSASGTPASLLVERSADEITVDKLLFVEGQYIKNPESAVAQVEPTKTSAFVGGVRVATDLTGNNKIIYDNWSNRDVVITIDSDNGVAFVKSMKFTSEAMTTPVSAAISNASSTAWIRGMNKDEIARNAIDSKAGRETENYWCELGRAVLEPTATVGLLRRIEDDLGANYFLSYKIASKAHAYQLNKASKDGQRTVTPMNEMLLGAIVGNMSSEDYTTGDYFNGFSSPFSAEAYKLGAASLAIAMYDSTAKYATKADVLTAPRSLRRAFQVADNNMNVFHAPSEFVAALNNVDVFSTIDRDYDPLLPVCITDRIGLISSISYSRFGDYHRDHAGEARTYDYTRFQYAFANRSSNYFVEVGHPLLDGFADLIESMASKIYDVCGKRSGELVINIPILSSTKAFSLWDFLVMYATPYVQKRRINSIRSILDYEVMFEYPFDTKSIKELNPLNAVNYNIVDIDTPLQSRRMIPSAAISWVMPEFFWGVSGTAGTNETRMVYPWYFSDLSFKASAGTDSDGGVEPIQEFMSGVMSLPVIRSGVRLGYLDDLYAMSERDLRLCLDRLTSTLTQDAQSSGRKYMSYKYGQANDGLPAFEEVVRIHDYISAPRELGYFMNAPHGYLRVADNLKDVVNGFAGFSSTDALLNGDTSFRLYCWKGVTDVGTDILAIDDANISRSQAFKQYWDCSPACYLEPIRSSVVGNSHRARLEVGFLVSMRQCFGTISHNSINGVTNQSYFRPFTTGVPVGANGIETQLTGSDNTVIALHKGLWGRLQKLPMVISPWDTCDFDGDIGGNYDPYDFPYMFNMAGFMASDYNQDLYDRSNQVQSQGWLFVSDPFVAASPIFKDSVKYTM